MRLKYVYHCLGCCVIFTQLIRDRYVDGNTPARGKNTYSFNPHETFSSFIIIPDKPQINILKGGRSSIIYVVDRQGRL